MFKPRARRFLKKKISFPSLQFWYQVKELSVLSTVRLFANVYIEKVRIKRGLKQHFSLIALNMRAAKNSEIAEHGKLSDERI